MSTTSSSGKRFSMFKRQDNNNNTSSEGSASPSVAEGGSGLLRLPSFTLKSLLPGSSPANAAQAALEEGSAIDTASSPAASVRSALSLPRRLSLDHLRFSSLLGNGANNEESKEDEEGEDFIETEHTVKLRTVIADKETRQYLINSLLEHKGEYMQKIRFISCVDELLSLPANMRQDKAKDICRFFVEPGGMFHCTGIPARVSHRLMNGMYDDYALVRDMFLNELAKTGEVQGALDAM